MRITLSNPYATIPNGIANSMAFPFNSRIPMYLPSYLASLYRVSGFWCLVSDLCPSLQFAVCSLQFAFAVPVMYIYILQREIMPRVS
jgi:hypothetical protein